MRIFWSVVAAAALALTALTQPVDLTPTLTGFLLDPSARALRPIVGVPGSAFVGASILNDLDGAWPAPSHDAAIAVRGGETFLVTGLRTVEPTRFDSQLTAHPSKVVWNASGKVAAILSTDSTSIQRVTLGRGGVQAGPADPIGYLGAIGAMAVNSSGDIAAATADGIYLLRTGSSPELIANQKALSLTFYSDDSLYASTEGSILHIGLREGSIQSSIVDARIEILCASPKARALLGIDGTSRKVFVFDLSGSLRSELSLDRVPMTLIPLQDDSVFVLNGIEEKQPVMVLKASLEPTSYFVPAESLNVP